MSAAAHDPGHTRLSESVYERIKNDIFDFRHRPGDRLTETELAQKLGVSRTPIRQALHRLEQEGYLQLAYRNGWTVRPFDFDRFEQLYDVRIIFERAALEMLGKSEHAADLAELARVWLVPPDQREKDPRLVSALDESFHHGLVLAAGNREMARLHREITEKIRIVRRLDFTQEARVEATWDEHGEILRLITKRKIAQAEMLLRSHIEASKAEVRKITLHMLHVAGQGLLAKG